MLRMRWQYVISLVWLIVSVSGCVAPPAVAPLARLAILHLSANEIKDILPLISLASLERLSLNQNQISDIAPLLENSGLDKGDHLDLKGNDLAEGSEDIADIRRLEERGVQVDY